MHFCIAGYYKFLMGLDMGDKFIKPTSLPFWSWNDDLQEDKLIKQIHEMKEQGYGGFFMHARSGLKTEYLGEKWFSCIRACCEEAKKLGMQAWAYDENGWPSGFVGGKLLETKEFRLHYLNSSIGNFDQSALYHYEIKDGALFRNEVYSSGEFINVFEKESISQADVLDDKVVDAFISETHERYKKEIKNFSDSIVGFFTDEPQYTQFCQTPYSKVLPTYYQEQYGKSLFDDLGLLFYEGVGFERFRYRYYKCCQELFLKNFAVKIYNWCSDNGVKLTGHYVEERTMFTQMLNNSGIMPYYEFLHMPGIDWLCRRYLRVNTIRQLTSVTAQLQKERALTETFAMTGWDVTPKELKNIADYQYNYGVNAMCQHLLPYSESGDRKNDYPTHFTSFNAWIDKGMLDFNRYFDALGEWIRSSKEDVDVGVLFTIRSAYVKYNPKDWKSCEDLDISYIDNCCENLANHHVAFHILDETLLSRYGGVKNGKITLGACSYSTLVVPKTIVIDKTTDDIFREFIKQGGKVLLPDGKPSFVGGEPNDFDYLKSNITFEEIFNSNEYFLSSDSVHLHTTLRTVNGRKYVFAVNIGDEEIKTNIKVNGLYFNGVYDVLGGSEVFVGNTFTIPPKESLIACFMTENERKPDKFETIEIGSYDYEIVYFNNNYLALDFASLSYDGVNYENKLPVVGIFRRLLEERYEGKVYLKYNFTVKERVNNASIMIEDAEKITATLNGKPLVFDGVSSLNEIYKTALVSDKILIGENQFVVEYYFHQPENVYFVLFGENVSESLRNCMTYETMITIPYLCGKFGVYSNNFSDSDTDGVVYAQSFYVDKAPKSARNLVEQGFAFFAGNVTLKRKFWANDGLVKLKLNGRFHIAEININGRYVGKVMFTDEIDVSEFVTMGENLLEIKLYSGNRNLLGPHHVVGKDLDTEVIPASFDFSDTWNKNSSPNFTERYSFSKFGLFDK